MKRLCSVFLLLLLSFASFALNDTLRRGKWYATGFMISPSSPEVTLSMTKYTTLRALGPESRVLAKGDVQAGDVQDRNVYFMMSITAIDAGVLIAPVHPRSVLGKQGEFYFGIYDRIKQEQNMAKASRSVMQTYNTGHFTGMNNYYQPADSVSYYFWGTSIRSNVLMIRAEYRFSVRPPEKRFNMVIAPYIGLGYTSSSVLDVYYYHSIYANQQNTTHYLSGSEQVLEEDSDHVKLPSGMYYRLGGRLDFVFKAGKNRNPPEGFFIGISMGGAFDLFAVNGKAMPSLTFTDQLIFIYRFGVKNAGAHTMPNPY